MRFRANQRHASQEEQVESALLRGESMTPLEALKRFGAFRLSAIIFNLREKGHDISTEMVGNGNRKYAMYKLKKTRTSGVDSQK